MFYYRTCVFIYFTTWFKLWTNSSIFTLALLFLILLSAFLPTFFIFYLKINNIIFVTAKLISHFNFTFSCLISYFGSLLLSSFKIFTSVSFHFNFSTFRLNNRDFFINFYSFKISIYNFVNNLFFFNLIKISRLIFISSHFL